MSAPSMAGARVRVTYTNDPQAERLIGRTGTVAEVYATRAMTSIVIDFDDPGTPDVAMIPETGDRIEVIA